jgi:hypothetical protein
MLDIYIEKNKQLGKVDLSELPDGIYEIIIESKNHRTAKKIVIVH